MQLRFVNISSAIAKSTRGWARTKQLRVEENLSRTFLRTRKSFIISDHYISTTNCINMYSSGKEDKKENYCVVDLRSDTVTKPTPAMRQAMFEAEVGDDVFSEDPTVNALEKMAASIVKKEAALFVPTGTMGNLLAIMVHCHQRGSEMIVGEKSHIFKYEQGGPAQLAGVQIYPIQNKSDGTFDLDEMEARIRGEDIHEPQTALVCVENTQNLCGGKVLPLNWLDELAQRISKYNIPLHLDGARLFNAAIHLNVPPARLVQDFASVNFCLSKGLGAPVGSILAGTEKFINQARRLRKAVGGGMRQVGVIAAAGIVALETRARLADDHFRAAELAKAIFDQKNKYITVDLENLHTNILLVDVDPKRVSAEDLTERLASVTKEEEEHAQSQGRIPAIIKSWASNNKTIRLVTHEGVSDSDLAAAIEKFKFVLSEYQ